MSGTPTPASPRPPMRRPRRRQERSNFTAGMTGFALGAVLTLLATLAVLPESATTEFVGAGGGVGPATGGGTFQSELSDPDAASAAGQDSGADASDGLSETGGSASDTGATDGAGGSGSSAGGVSVGNANAGGATVGGGQGSSSGDCRPRDTGAPGVSDDEIKLGATVVRSGFASAFLGEVLEAMRAVEFDVNKRGGICGRQLKVVPKDDGWKPDEGMRAIQNLINQEKVFALAVSPSSEGLNQASQANVFRNAKVPVIGADGLNRTQFKDPYIWPVAAATTTTVHVIMKNAWDRCQAIPACKSTGLQPAIVFGNTYRFGVEGAYAFNAAYNELSGKDIPGYKDPLGGGGGGCSEGTRFCGVGADAGQYANQVSIVNNACDSGKKCNFILLLLEPRTAEQWMATTGARSPADFETAGGCCGMAGAQPLFTASFARNCGDQCNKMWVWTGYNPPIEQYAPSRNAATREYVNALHSVKGNADEFNQFTEGGYIGMKLVVKALEAAGAELTRERLAEVLNSMPPLDTGLSVPLAWREDARYANHSAQAFTIPSAQGWTGGWEFAQGYIKDPWLGEHTG